MITLQDQLTHCQTQMTIWIKKMNEVIEADSSGENQGSVNIAESHVNMYKCIAASLIELNELKKVKEHDD